MIKIFYVIPFMLITILIINLATLASVDPSIPITYVRLEIQTLDIYAGSPIIIRVFRKNNRDDCVIISNRQAKHVDGTLYNLPDSVYLDPGATLYTDITFNTTSDMKLGSYLLQANITYLCDQNQTFLLRQPDAIFTILERPING